MRRFNAYSDILTPQTQVLGVFKHCKDATTQVHEDRRDSEHPLHQSWSFEFCKLSDRQVSDDAAAIFERVAEHNGRSLHKSPYECSIFLLYTVQNKIASRSFHDITFMNSLASKHLYRVQPHAVILASVEANLVQ